MNYFEERLRAVVNSHNGSYIGKYKNCKSKLTFICSKGHNWEAPPRKITEGSWCHICSIEKNRIYNCNYDFFSKDNEASFYWAGFIAADGWVVTEKCNYLLGIDLSIKDIKHLEKFKKSIDATQPIRKRIKKGGNINGKELGHSEMCSIKIHSKQIVEDLKKFNVIPNKTYFLDIPEWLMEHKLLHHYLRGYIDGNGCFTVAQNKGQKPHVTFCMRGTYKFLNQFSSNLHKKGVLLRSRKENEPIAGKKYLAFDKIQYSGNTVISKMYDCLYKDAALFLDRKEEICKKAKEWGVHSGGMATRKIKEGSIDISPEELLKLAEQYKSYSEVADKLGCSNGNLSIIIKNLNVRNEFRDICRGYSDKDIYNSYIELGRYTDVGYKYGIGRQAIKEIISKVQNTKTKEEIDIDNKYRIKNFKKIVKPKSSTNATVDYFINKANKIHNNKYNYDKTVYRGAKTEVIITCKEHGDFTQTPNCHYQSGCPICSRNKSKKTQKQFLEDLKRIHGDKYDYSKAKYVSAKTEVIIICAKHGEFTTYPNRLISGKKGCKKCGFASSAKKSSKTQEQFLKDCKKIHGDKYNYSKAKYISAKTEITIICPKHGEFITYPNRLTSGKHGCNKCSAQGISKKEIAWIKSLNNPNIELDKMLKIKNRIIKPDGYDPTTNTIYEFNGDYWHGNPKKFNKNEINKHVNKTFGELYKKTINRENFLKKHGYNVVSMWESDFV